MNLSIPVVSAAAVFAQGLLSFFSPCVLPLIPLYMGYLSGGAGFGAPGGTPGRRRLLTLAHTACFVAGVSFAFILLGFGFTAAGRFFNRYHRLFTVLGGALVVFFGLYQLGALGGLGRLGRQYRLPLALDRMAIHPLSALLLGFVFSFAWTPCVGPALTSVLLLAASADTMASGLALVGVYTLGFVLPFLALGLFTGQVLAFFKKHAHIVRGCAKAGGVLLVMMGLMMIAGWTDRFGAALSGAPDLAQTDPPSSAPAASGPATQRPSAPQTTAQPEPTPVAAPDFTLTDQYGVSHTLSQYQGKVVFLNFWATWCGPCRSEMPDIQALYEQWEQNGGDVVILGVAAPGQGDELDAAGIARFLSENGYAYPVLMDPDGAVFARYGVSGVPITWLIDAQGNLYGYIPGAAPRQIMDEAVLQTLEAQP